MFDVSNFAPRDQFEAAVIVSGVCLAAAVVLREWFTDREIRIIARALGFAGYAVVVSFAWRMTETNETLATQLMVKGKADAKQISDQNSVVAVESEFSRTIGDSLVSVIKYSDGRFGSVSVASRRGSGIWGSSGKFARTAPDSDGTTFRADHGRDGMQDAESVRDF